MSKIADVLDLLEQRQRISAMISLESASDAGIDISWYRTLRGRLFMNIAEIDVRLKALSGHRDAPEQDEPEAF